ncbi:MAG: GNAT family N-acetyltransferase [Leptolyngbyaceae cyanobacterium bins.349]|nr:GNAT family N-acetyltransferase [Leptolyngbyaceae cyanobacterium bins.349]
MPPSLVQIRAATIADLDQILELIHQKAAFDGVREPLPVTSTRLRQTLFSDRPCAEVLLAAVNDRAVGFVLFFPTYSSFLAQPSLWIDDLFVQADWRRQGIGTTLLSAVVNTAKTRNCGRIEWTVATSNATGIEFYQHHGAQIREQVRLCRLPLPCSLNLP